MIGTAVSIIQRRRNCVHGKASFCSKLRVCDFRPLKTLVKQVIVSKLVITCNQSLYAID